MASETREATTGEQLRETVEAPEDSGGEAAEAATSPASAESGAGADSGRARADAGSDRAGASGDPDLGGTGAGRSGAGGSEAGDAEVSAEPAPAGAGGARHRTGRARRFVARTALVLGALAAVMAGALLGACAINDRTIAESQGSAVAEVVDTSPVRAAVRFTTDDGRVYIPAAGVLYPSGLKPGQQVYVEYDTRNPDLVRVADRTVAVALLPVGTALGGTWLVLGTVYLAARRR
ncbi:DUF3592 domain-containing protein [Salinifilum aidingensis]